MHDFSAAGEVRGKETFDSDPELMSVVFFPAVISFLSDSFLFSEGRRVCSLGVRDPRSIALKCPQICFKRACSFMALKAATKAFKLCLVGSDRRTSDQQS